MQNILRKVASRSKQAVKSMAKRMLPPSKGRLTGKLALHGGEPVRDLRYHPWASSPYKKRRSAPLPSSISEIYRSGLEGLPQSYAKQFAQQWAEYCGCKYGLLLPHGTDALRFGLAAALDHDGLDYGGEVIVPNLSFIASATSALAGRFGVAFVDVEPATLLIDPQRVEEAIVPGRTRAIMPVHLFGQPADMSALREIAKRHDLKIVEDAAQAHGSVLDIGPAGSLGDVAGFSFQSSKNLACGEGGALTTNDEDIFERAYSMHDAGRPHRGRERWSHLSLGWNCRTTEYQAALLAHRFTDFPKQQETRLRNFFTLREMLEEVTCVESLAIRDDVRRHGAYMFLMRYHAEKCGGLSISDFVTAIQREGAPINRAYTTTVSDQPAMRDLVERRPDYIRILPTPVAEQAAREILYFQQELFLGTEGDMHDLLAILRKVESYYAPGQAQPRPEKAHNQAHARRSSRISVSEQQPLLRCGVIGVGVMGRYHAEALAKHSDASLIGITDANSEAQSVAQAMGCRWFGSPQEMISNGAVDTVIIATPHWQHAKLSIASLRGGLHTICEKPLTVTVSQADEVLQAAQQSKALFAVVHQNRLEPVYLRAKEILESGKLGPMLRCSMIETAWRSDAYYKSSPWRGTWHGEGGGVLLNQAPHVLDRYAWFCGMPKSVMGLCNATLHKIEVEDCASAVLEHQNGAHGYIHINTNECPFFSQTVITCDKGRLTLEQGKLTVTRLRRSISETTRTDSRIAGDIEAETEVLNEGSTSSIPALLDLFYRNFALTVAGKAQLISAGDEGLHAVELANAIIFSSAQQRTVLLPLSRTGYDEFIESKIELPGKVA